MKALLISINPEHVSKILSGEKKYEYRTRVAKEKVNAMLIYETSPVQKIVAMAKIKNILCDTPDLLWRKTKKHSGITKEFFDRYFEGKKTAYAYELCNVTKLNENLSLQSLKLSNAPQSFMYVDF